MTIKQLGGVFGRNPTFNNVTIEGTLTFDGDIDINSDLTIGGNLDVNGSVTANVFEGSINSFNAESSNAITAKNNFYIDIDSDNTATNRSFRVTHDGATKTLLDVQESGNISFYNTAAAQGLFWDSSASALGLGTTAPAYLMHLEDSNGADLALGNSTVSPSAGDYLGRIYALDSGDNFFAGINMFYHDANDGEMRFRVKTDGTNADVMTLVDGNVGINVADPTHRLEVVKDNTYAAKFGGDGGGSDFSIEIGQSGTSASPGFNATAGSMLFSMAGTEAARIDASGDLNLVKNDGQSNLNFTTDGSLDYARITGGKSGSGVGELQFWTYSSGISRAATINSSGMLLVGRTNTSIGNTGHVIAPEGFVYHERDGGTSVMFLNRLSSDGDIARFYKDTALVGAVGVKQSDAATGDGELFVASGNTGLFFDDLASPSNYIRPCNASGGLRDNIVDLGASNSRFKDIYATNGTIQTSDRNEKQDIEELSDAEQRVAVAAKGLLRKFRWKSSVAEKGDDARTHFGIIAQDLQAAFEAEGLDAGDYAMFINSTWTDEETGEERSRMGVRYSELLAFIIAAI